jgi:hypothetical protein
MDPAPRTRTTTTTAIEGTRRREVIAAAVEHTYDWFRREGLDRTSQFDFTVEDNLLEHLRASTLQTT